MRAICFYEVSQSTSIVRTTHLLFPTNPSSLCEESFKLPTTHPPLAPGHTLSVGAGDWTSPGCSFETRERILLREGVHHILFEGNDGTAFWKDGAGGKGLSQNSSLLLTKDYQTLSFHQTGNITLSPLTLDRHPSLLLSYPYSYIQWMALTFFFTWSFLNICLAAYLLRKGRGNRLTKCVLLLELLSQLCECVFLLDGPFLEHTHPSLLGFPVWRMFTSAQLQFRVLSLCLVGIQLRRIFQHTVLFSRERDLSTHSTRTSSSSSSTKRISRLSSSLFSQSKILPSSSKRSKGTRSFQESLKKGGDSPRPSSREATSPPLLTKGEALLFSFFLLLFGADLLLVVLTSLFLLPSSFTTVSASYSAAYFSLSGIFFWKQARVIVNHTHPSQTSMKRFARHVTHNSICMLLFVLTFVLAEVARVVLEGREERRLYWNVLYPIWTLTLLFHTLGSTFQILAYHTTHNSSTLRTYEENYIDPEAASSRKGTVEDVKALASFVPPPKKQTFSPPPEPTTSHKEGHSFPLSVRSSSRGSDPKLGTPIKVVQFL